jgi:hypothetical protein
VSRASIERRLLDISDRIKQAAAELAVTDEQLSFLDEEAEDARLRAIVAETPMEVATANEAARHADALRRHRDALMRSIGELRTEQDELLDRMTAEPAPRCASTRGIQCPRNARESSSPKTRRSFAST